MEQTSRDLLSLNYGTLRRENNHEVRHDLALPFPLPSFVRLYVIV